MKPGSNPSTFSHTNVSKPRPHSGTVLLGHFMAFFFFFNLWSSNLSSACDIWTAKLNSPDEFLLCVQEANGDKVLALEKSSELSGGSNHNHVSGHRPNEQQPWDTAIQFIYIKEVLREMPCWNFSHEGMKVSKINRNYACKVFGALRASTCVSCSVLC